MITSLPSALLRVLTIPAFQDNYLWLIHDGRHAAVVDPGDAAPVLAALADHGLTLTAILLTHHHADHIGGVASLLAHAKVPVYGPRNEAITCVSVALGEGDQVTLAAPALNLRVLDVPGHTRGHIAYVRRNQSEPDVHWLFCGDTLFGAGCGRLFEGTPAQMGDSLAKLAALPDDTLVFCAHEYTLANLRFAAAVEPDNPALAERITQDSAARAHGQPTIPSTIGREKASNPFLRHRQPAILAKLMQLGKLADANDPVASFAALRTWKNSF